MTSIHAIANKSRMKSSTTETRKVNIISTDSDITSVVPLKQTNMNRDNNDVSVSPTTADSMACCLSPSKKPKNENDSSITHTHKRKSEHLRKKGLKRL